MFKIFAMSKKNLNLNNETLNISVNHVSDVVFVFLFRFTNVFIRFCPFAIF